MTEEQLIKLRQLVAQNNQNHSLKMSYQVGNNFDIWYDDVKGFISDKPIESYLIAQELPHFYMYDSIKETVVLHILNTK